MRPIGIAVVSFALVGCVVGDDVEEDSHPDWAPEVVPSVWPNATSHTNGDKWLRDHHAQIRELHPKVLILVANNKISTGFIADKRDTVIAANKEASRYHGYSKTNPGKPELIYNVVKIADMRDSSTTPYPADWPVTIGSDGKPNFVYDGLFTPEFAKHYGYVDPDSHPTRYFTLCELFEHGIINEMWVAGPRYVAPDGTRGDPIGVYEARARMQKYDPNDQPLAGQFNDEWPAGAHDRCKVTTRLVEFATDEGGNATSDGGDLHARGHAFEGMRKAIPMYRVNSARFFHLDLDKLYQQPVDSQYAGCKYYSGDCWFYPNANTLGTSSAGGATATLLDAHWNDGCGNTHFAPDSVTHYDYKGAAHVTTSCETYGYPAGQGVFSLYGADTTTGSIVADYESRFGKDGNGGGWQMYMMQSFPGYGTKAIGEDGKPMKSWWPYLYY